MVLFKKTNGYGLTSGCGLICRVNDTYTINGSNVSCTCGRISILKIDMHYIINCVTENSYTLTSCFF